MQILGIHYDRPFIRWALLDHKSKKTEILSLKSFIPTDPDHVKQLYIQEKKNAVATGIKAIVRTLNFKVNSRKKIEAGLPFQVESLTHLTLDELVYSSQIFPHKTGADATIFLAAKESLVSHLHDWHQQGIRPDLVTAIPQALMRFTQFRMPELKEGFIVYLGSEDWTCIWMKEGVIQKTFVIEEGIEALLSALWEDRKKVLFQNEVKGVAKQIDLFQLKPNLNPQLFKRVESLRSTLISVIHSFQQQSGPQPLVFTGRTDSFSHLCEYLLSTSPEIELYVPPLPIHLDELKSAVAIGLAIESAGQKQPKVQFLQGDFIPDRQWRKAGIKAMALMTLSAMMTFGFWSYGSSLLNEQKQMIAASLQTVVGQIDKKLESSLFLEGIESGVAQSLRMIQKYDKEAPFLLQAPTVAEVLAWVSHHPVGDALAKAGDPIDLVDLHYQLVSFPKIGAMRDPYLAKVELQFRVNSSMSARKFHEELLKGDDLVDPNSDIVWENLGEDRYMVSFYLKNRTPHVY